MMLKYFGSRLQPTATQGDQSLPNFAPAGKKIDNSKARWWALKHKEHTEGQCAESTYEKTFDTEGG